MPAPTAKAAAPTTRVEVLQGDGPTVPDLGTAPAPPEVLALFAADGPLAQGVPGYEPRPAQVAMAQAVACALRDHRHLLVEAPTGTGKSAAYIAAAAWWTRHTTPLEVRTTDIHGGQTTTPDRPRVLLVTANLTLQGQLVGKDLPAIIPRLPWPVEYRLAKGRGNYLCRQKFSAWAQMDKALRYAGLLSKVEQDQADKLHAWGLATKTGDVAELPFVPPRALWVALGAYADDCTDGTGPWCKECCYRLARGRLATADLIVCNYALYFAHLRVQQRTGGLASILPPHGAVVFDEGHKAADIARDHFGVEFSPGLVRTALFGLRRTPYDDVRDRIIAWSDTLGSVLHALANDAEAYRGRLRAPLPEEQWAPVAQELRTAAVEAYKALASRILAESTKPSELAVAAHYVAKGRACAELGGQLAALASLDYERTHVTYIECPPPGDIARGRQVPLASLRSRLIYPATVLQDTTFRLRAAIVTSATLAVGSSFDYIRGELGAPPDIRTCVVPSAFDLPRQALLVLPDVGCAPNDEGFGEAVQETVADVITAAAGRTLALFTSNKHLRATARHLRDHECAYTLLVQGEGGKDALLEQFRTDVSSVLLGVASLWEGVDVPGEALSCVVIDRIPFTPPDDPVLSWRQEHEQDQGSVFFRVQVPQAAMLLKQGFGRLIRSRHDRGVVVILDERLRTKRYGRQLVGALPRVRVTMDLAEVRRFLEAP